MKLLRISVPAQQAASSLALSKPLIGPQSRPTARAAMMRQPPCRLELRNAVVSANSFLPTNDERASACGNRVGSLS